MNLFIGLMSGTSMDGIDVAIVDMPSHQLIAGMTKQYSHETRLGLSHLVLEQDLTFASICQLNTLIGREFALAVNELLENSNISPNEIRAIGSHGQTICHNTSTTIPYTLQLGCAHTISSLTGITVVADFRTRDLVHGGQGAPFAPLYHKELFGDFDDLVAIANIGGIANISFINSHQHGIQGWDVGPGNCLMDAWISKHLGCSFDADGAWASQGKVISELLDQLLSDAFFSLTPPKSIGKEYFSLSWLERYLKTEYQAVDIMATLSALTAHSIAHSIINHSLPVNQLYLCGGGTHNLSLRTTLNQLLPNRLIQSTADVGISPDYLEAMMFAWFAYLTMNHIPVDLSSITGSKGPEILGAIYPGISLE